MEADGRKKEGNTKVTKNSISDKLKKKVTKTLEKKDVRTKGKNRSKQTTQPAKKGDKLQKQQQKNVEKSVKLGEKNKSNYSLVTEKLNLQKRSHTHCSPPKYD